MIKKAFALLLSMALLIEFGLICRANGAPSYLPVQVEDCASPTCVPWSSSHPMPSSSTSTPTITPTPGLNIFNAVVSSTTPVLLFAAGGASTYNEITGFTITNNSAVTVVAVIVSGGVTIWGPHGLSASFGGAVVEYLIPQPTPNAGTSIILGNAVTSVCISGVYNVRK